MYCIHTTALNTALSDRTRIVVIVDTWSSTREECNRIIKLDTLK